MNLFTFAESGTTTNICLLQNPQQNQCADKTYRTIISTRIPQKFCKWNPLTFGNLFEDFSLESRNLQTQNCAPIQCTVWPRKDPLNISTFWVHIWKAISSPINFCKGLGVWKLCSLWRVYSECWEIIQIANYLCVAIYPAQ